MELYVYSRDMTLQGIVEKISSLIWTRRYWSCGEFKLLVPFTEEHARLLVKENIIIKRGGNEAAEIRYIHITKNSQGMEEIEVQGKFLLSWIGKRILTTQIITKDTTQNILYAIVKQTCTNAGAARNIPNFSISTTDADTGSGQIDYTSEQYANAQLAAETAAKAAKLGIRVLTNARTGKHTFSVYEGRDLTAGNTAGNAPCIFSQEFDNIVEQEYTNSVENLKTTAYVGGEEKEGVTRKVAEVGGSAAGLSRDEVFINATDIVQEYENESGQTVTLTTAQYLALLSARGVEELEQYAETLAFGSKINTNANLKYGTDYDLGDRVTCINKRWNGDCGNLRNQRRRNRYYLRRELARASDTNSADYEIKEGFTAWKNQVSSTAFRTIARTRRRIGRNTLLRSSGTAFSPSLRRGFKSLQTTE